MVIRWRPKELSVPRNNSGISNHPVISMTFTNTSKNSIQRRTERSEVHSRPKGMNAQDHFNNDLNRKLTRIHQRTGSHPKVLQEYLRDQLANNFQPNWFITLLRNDLPTHFDTVEIHSKTFKNIFLTQLFDCRSPTKIPDPANRPSMILMQERKPVIHHGRQILAFHTHLHLGALPDPLNHLWHLDHLIHQKVSPRVQKLLKTTSDGNWGVVSKPWVWDQHAF